LASAIGAKSSHSRAQNSQNSYEEVDARSRARQVRRAHLRLDYAADRQGLLHLYESFGFALHSVVRIGTTTYAQYEIRSATL